MEQELIKIGTRNSLLALTQAGLVKSALERAYPELIFELIPAITTGDYRRDKLNLNVEDKKQWVIEIERMLLNGEIDLAIHSAKDVPLNIEIGTELKTVLPRECASDLVCYRNSANLTILTNIHELPQRAMIGTSSKRRVAQLLKLRPDLQIVPIRGNVTTRLEKLNMAEELDAIVIATAGMNRLNISNILSFKLSLDEMVPAVGQGQLLAQFLSKNNKINKLLESVSVAKDQLLYEVERLVIDILGADCHSSIGVNARIREENFFMLDVVILSLSGDRILRKQMTGRLEEALLLASKAAEELKTEGAESLLACR